MPAPSKDTILVFKEELNAVSPALYSVLKAAAEDPDKLVIDEALVATAPLLKLVTKPAAILFSINLCA